MLNCKADTLDNELASTEIVFRCKGVNTFQQLFFHSDCKLFFFVLFWDKPGHFTTS